MTNDKKVVRINKNNIAVGIFRKGYELANLKISTNRPDKTVFFFFVDDEQKIYEDIVELKEKYWN